MNFLTLSGIVVQVLCLVLVFRTVRRHALSHIGLLFLAMTVLFHGLTEVLQWLYPQYAFYRKLTEEDALVRWGVLISVSVALFSVVYWLGVRSSQVQGDSLRKAFATRMALPSWQITAAAATPLFLVLLAVAGDETDSYWVLGLASEFALVLVALTAVGVIAGGGARSRYSLPILALMILMLGLTGSRLTVMSCLVIVVVLCAKLRAQIPRAITYCAIGFALCYAVLTTFTRSTYGYEVYSSSLTERVQALISSASDMQGVDHQAVMAQWVPRFDGNAFSAQIWKAEDDGLPPAGAHPLMNNLLTSIPSFLYASKTSKVNEEIHEEAYVTHYFGFPHYDYIGTVWTYFYACFGGMGLLCGAPLLGFAFAKIDNWTNRRPTLAGVFVALWLIQCATHIEQGCEIYFLAGRGIAVIWFIHSAYSHGRKWLGAGRDRSAVAGQSGMQSGMFAGRDLAMDRRP